MELLGDTLGAIAREKAGIFKPHVPAFTALQEDEAMQQLKKRAEEIGAPLQVARTLDEYSLESGSGRNAAELRLGLDGVHQRSNAALAVALCHAWEKKCGMSGTSRRRCEMLSQGILPKEYEEGLTHVEWPGRAQIIAESPNVTYFLDGAHTSESMNACASWFVESSNRLCDRARTGDTYERWMLFYCKKDRNPERLLSPLSHHLRNSHMDLTRALFVVPDSSVTTLTPAQCPDPQSSWERHLQLTWEKLRAGLPTPPPLQTNWPVMDASNTCHSAVVPSVAMAMKWIRDYPKHQPSKRLHVLVTGSLYLVGDALRVLRNGRLF